jgi:hypothetical protein
MYTQELICPHCGDVATVNVLTSVGTKNPQSGRCHNCKDEIYFDVGSDGEIMRIHESEDVNTTSDTGGGRREPRW